jgi:hypothetical protein
MDAVGSAVARAPRLVARAAAFWENVLASAPGQSPCPASLLRLGSLFRLDMSRPPRSKTLLAAGERVPAPAIIDEAFGRSGEGAGAPKISAQQLALREAGLCAFSSFAFEMSAADWRRVVGVLDEEFASGAMPASRQAITLMAALSRSDEAAATNADRPLIELGARIAAQKNPPFSWGDAFTLSATPPSNLPAELLVGDAGHVAKAEKAARSDFAAHSFSRSLLGRLLMRRGDAVWRELERLGGLPREALGPQATSFLLEAVLPLASMRAPEAQPRGVPSTLFMDVLRRLGLDQEPHCPGPDPLLLDILSAVRHNDDAAESSAWLDIVAQEAASPWLRFDHAKFAWRGAHPLHALAELAPHLRPGSNFPETVQAVLAAGYGPDWSFPEGKPPVSPTLIRVRAQSQPDALWAFFGSIALFPGPFATLDALLAAGANPSSRRAATDDRPERALLAQVNENAKHANSAPIRDAWGRLFKQLVAAGADPLDALPPPSAKDMCDGPIREIVSAAIERRDLREAVEAIDPADLAEAMALLREKRAHEKQAKQAASQDCAAPPSSAPGRRL